VGETRRPVVIPAISARQPGCLTNLWISGDLQAEGEIGQGMFDQGTRFWLGPGNMICTKIFFPTRTHRWHMDGIRFEKMHGLGNDFVIIDARHQNYPSGDTIQAMADRQRGIGFDQLVVLHGATPVEMDIYNADGSRAGACGNVTRCVARLLDEEGMTMPCIIRTTSADLTASKVADGYEVDMGTPRRLPSQIPFTGAMDGDEAVIPGTHDRPELRASLVNMGNPHAVLFGDDELLTKAEIWGPLLSTHRDFPEGVNVGFGQILSDGHLRLRVHERGAGVTLACGSGACAAVVAAVDSGRLSPGPVAVDTDGGRLTITYAGGQGHVLMAGPAAHVFGGVWHDR